MLTDLSLSQEARKLVILSNMLARTARWSSMKLNTFWMPSSSTSSILEFLSCSSRPSMSSSFARMLVRNSCIAPCTASTSLSASAPSRASRSAMVASCRRRRSSRIARIPCSGAPTIGRTSCGKLRTSACGRLSRTCTARPRCSYSSMEGTTTVLSFPSSACDCRGARRLARSPASARVALEWSIVRAMHARARSPASLPPAPSPSCSSTTTGHADRE